jgi:hypothetical protein
MMSMRRVIMLKAKQIGKAIHISKTWYLFESALQVVNVKWIVSHPLLQN